VGKEWLVPVDDEPRRDGTDRYAVYEIVRHSSGAPLGAITYERNRIAETSGECVISTIECLYDEGQIARGARVGVFDRERRTWVLNPFA
jgi:hypothetical protein